MNKALEVFPYTNPFIIPFSRSDGTARINVRSTITSWKTVWFVCVHGKQTYELSGLFKIYHVE